MDRRNFIRQAAVAGGALAAAGLFGDESKAGEAADAGPHGGKQPNILFILVDEMRYPSVFPKGVRNAGEFLQKYMPKTHSLWRRGVKFSGHYTAGVACTPARGTLVTGLYTQQSWLLATILDSPTTKVSIQPVLSRQYPTYGKLLREAGYRTPYIGKWHLSIPHRNPNEELEAYGFDGKTEPDPTGSNLQGTIGDEAEQPGYLSDGQIAAQAATFLGARKPGERPWCLTVGFVNPHDKEFFPAGTEFLTFTNLFNSSANPGGFAQFIDFTKGPPTYDWNNNPLKTPPSLAYPPIPPNWESADHIAKHKPKLQSFARLFQEAVWGGVSDDPNATDFSVVEYPTNPADPKLQPPYGVGKAPYSYWQRSLDSYTQIMTALDDNIGTVLEALPAVVRENTIIVFTSDHGEYASAHGFVSGKAASCYDEVYNVPLIVVDPSGRFTGDTDDVRTGLTSAVDILPLLVSLGYRGGRGWLAGDIGRIYRRRHNLLPMLKSADARGRPYVVFATDETVPNLYNFNNAPAHVIGVRTQNAKLGVYANWAAGTTDIAFDGTLETEYYDYSTPRGRLEIDNRKHEPGAALLYQALLHDILPHELRAPLPLSYVAAQTVAKNLYIDYVNLINQATASALPIEIGDV